MVKVKVRPWQLQLAGLMGALIAVWACYPYGSTARVAFATFFAGLAALALFGLGCEVAVWWISRRLVISHAEWIARDAALTRNEE